MSINRQRRSAAVLSTACLGVFLWMALVQPSTAAAQLTVKDVIGKAVTIEGTSYRNVSGAIVRFLNGKSDEARDFLVEAKKQHPRLPPADIMLATMMLRTNQQSAARGALEKAVENAPEDPEAYVSLAELALGERRYVEAAMLLAKAEKLLSTFTENSRRKHFLSIRLAQDAANLAIGRQNWGQAQKQLDKLLELDPGNTDALRQMALVRVRQDDFSNAYRTFIKLYELDAESGRPEINMAQAYQQAAREAEDEEKKKEYEGQAARLIELAVERAGDDEATRLAAASWALNRGQFEDARKHATAAIDAEETSTRAHLVAGIAARALGDHAAAEESLRRAQFHSPATAAIRNHLILALIEQASDPKKQTLAAQYAQINSRLFSNLRTTAGREAGVVLGWVLYRGGDAARAEATVRRALSQGGASNEMQYRAAVILNDRGDRVTAQRLLENALQEDTQFVGRSDAEKLLAKLKGS